MEFFFFSFHLQAQASGSSEIFSLHGITSQMTILTAVRPSHCSQSIYFPFDANLEGHIPVYISPRNRVAQLYPWVLGSLLVASQGNGGSILTRLHMRLIKVGLGYFVTEGQSPSLSWCQAPIWGPCPDFYYCQTFAVFLSRPSPSELMTTSYWLI
jgi:hypothetical protein